MLRKINLTLIALNIFCLIVFGGVQLYVHKSDVAQSDLVKQMGAVQ